MCLRYVASHRAQNLKRSHSNKIAQFRFTYFIRDLIRHRLPGNFKEFHLVVSWYPKNTYSRTHLRWGLLPVSAHWLLASLVEIDSWGIPETHTQIRMKISFFQNPGTHYVVFIAWSKAAFDYNPNPISAYTTFSGVFFLTNKYSFAIQLLPESKFLSLSFYQMNQMKP